MKFLKIEDLSGRWLCESTGFHYGEPDYNTTWNGVMTISQTYDEILIKLDTDDSTSYSTQAQLDKIKDNEYMLSYYYTNNPKASADRDMHKHYGSCRIFFDMEHGLAEADYFTDRDSYYFVEFKIVGNCDIHGNYPLEDNNYENPFVKQIQ